MEQIAERAGISRYTLDRIEKGEEGVAMGHYFRVLPALGLESDLLLVAKSLYSSLYSARGFSISLEMRQISIGLQTKYLLRALAKHLAVII